MIIHENKISLKDIWITISVQRKHAFYFFSWKLAFMPKVP